VAADNVTIEGVISPALVAADQADAARDCTDSKRGPNFKTKPVAAADTQ
jgi:hypothetical protein